MKRIALFLFTHILLFSGPVVASPYVIDLLIRDVRIVSPHIPFSGEKSDVLLRNGTIHLIGKAARSEGADSAKIIDAEGMFLLPGLIDGHTHLNEIPGMTFAHEEEFPEIAKAARRQIPRSYLYHGFTSLVDLNSEPNAIAQWNNRDIRPQAYFCGAAPVFDGYPMSFMPKPLRYQIMPYFLFDDNRAGDFPAGFSPDAHSPTNVVSRIKNDGGICVKTHYERGFGGRGDLPVPGVDLVKELIAAAHKDDLPVLLHANSQSSQNFGVEAGVDAFAHGMWTWDERQAREMNDARREIIDSAFAKGIALQPTIQVLYGEQDIHNPEYLDDPRLRKVLPQSLIDWYATEPGQWWRKRMLNIPIVAELVEKGLWAELDEPPIARVSAALGYFSKQEGQLLFGSDTPSDPTFANPPGLNGRLEMNNWIAAGVSLEQLFHSLTINNAKFFGLYEQIGSVEQGKRADLLLTSQNPLTSVSAYDSIQQVILGGILLDRASLQAQ
ncbi:MAG: amidohydrolase family protein [Pseudomonadota bacterium]